MLFSRKLCGLGAIFNKNKAWHQSAMTIKTREFTNLWTTTL